MNLSKPETELLLQVLDHALDCESDGCIAPDECGASDLAYVLMQRLRDHQEAEEAPEKPVEPRYELRTGAPKSVKAVLFSAAESPRHAILEYLNVTNTHINALGKMKEEIIDGETVFHFPIHLSWPILFKPIDAS